MATKKEFEARVREKAEKPKPAPKPAEKAPDVQGQIDRLQKRARDLEAWQDEVEDAFARSLNLLIGSKREAAEEALEAEES